MEKRLNAQNLIMIGAAIIIVYLVGTPLIFLFHNSFISATETGGTIFTLNNYISAYTNPLMLGLFKNSLLFAVGTSVISISIGTFIAWINERTETRFKSVIYIAALVPLIMPGILFTISWIFLLSPDIGIINKLLMQIFFLDSPPFNIYSISGMIWVEGLHMSPLAFLLMSSVFKSMDPSLEEAASMSGATVFQTLTRITLRLNLPAILGVLLIIFVRSIEAFEVPAIIGLPVGIQVFTSQIYLALRTYPANYGLASTYSITLLAMTTMGIYLNYRIISQSRKYATITGKGFTPRTISMSPATKYIIAGLLITYMLVIIILPLLILVWSSLNPFYAIPSWEALNRLSFKNYIKVVNHPGILQSSLNSMFLAFTSAAIIMILATLVSWMVIRGKAKGRWLLDNIATFPLVFPGIVIGVAIMFVYLRVPIPIYGTIWILLIAYVTKFLPYGLRYSSPAMAQISAELEEAAVMSGGSWFKTMQKIIIPLLTPGLLGGFLYIVIVALRELSSSVLLYSPGSQVISITIWEMWTNGDMTKLSALGVIMIIFLAIMVLLSQYLSKRFGIKQNTD